MVLRCFKKSLDGYWDVLDMVRMIGFDELLLLFCWVVGIEKETAGSSFFPNSGQTSHLVKHSQAP